MSQAHPDPAATDPHASLVRRYQAAADDAAKLTKPLRAADLQGRMRAAVDALWTQFSSLGAELGISWVGFYLPERALDAAGRPAGEHLVLGPSRNKPACSPIGLHGVCGQAYLGRCVRLVADVRDLGPDYIACDPRDRSELVVPLVDSGTCVAVLDLDSYEAGRFTSADVEGIRRVLLAAGLPG